MPVVVLDSSDHETELVTFTVKGKHLKTKEPWEETFELAPALPPTAITPLVASFLRDETTGELRATIGAMVNFIDRLLLDRADKERWYDVVNNPALLLVDVDLGEAIQQLVENDLVSVPFGLPGGWRTSSPPPTSSSTSEGTSSPPAETPTSSDSETGSPSDSTTPSTAPEP